MGIREWLAKPVIAAISRSDTRLRYIEMVAESIQLNSLITRKAVIQIMADVQQILEEVVSIKAATAKIKVDVEALGNIGDLVAENARLTQELLEAAAQNDVSEERIAELEAASAEVNAKLSEVADNLGLVKEDLNAIDTDLPDAPPGE